MFLTDLFLPHKTNLLISTMLVPLPQDESLFFLPLNSNAWALDFSLEYTRTSTFLLTSQSQNKTETDYTIEKYGD